MTSSPESPSLSPFWKAVLRCSQAMALAAFATMLAIIAIVCGDILLRTFGHPVKGAYDLVRVAGVLAVSCALPLTTASKGHVAIEYFFQKLRRTGRIVVDTLMRLIMLAGFILAAAECVRRGFRFLRSGEVTQTIELPVFWVPWVMAAAFALTSLVVFFHLIHPGRDLSRP
jgi:TRAP-type C4-dicarboxylate transport system permease small subunit